MKKLRHILAMTLLLASISFPLVSSAKGWESVKPEKTAGHHVISEPELEILAGGGLIYVTTSKNVNIKIFSILGSRISDENLSAGTYQFAVPTHGVYIIKAGDLTCKVAV